MEKWVWKDRAFYERMPLGKVKAAGRIHSAELLPDQDGAHIYVVSKDANGVVNQSSLYLHMDQFRQLEFMINNNMRNT